MDIRSLSLRSTAALRAAALAGCVLLAPQADAADRIFDWPSSSGQKDGGWSVQKFGPARSAEVRSDRAGAAAALEARIESADDRPPQAQLRMPLPFRAGHRYRATLELSAPDAIDVDVMLRRAPAPYDPIGIRTVRLGPTPKTVVVEGVWPYGDVQGDLRIVWRQPNGRVTVRRTSVDDLGPSPFGATLPAGFPPTLLGVHINRFGQHRTWPAAGQKLIRFWDTYTTWSRIAPTEPEQDSDSTEGLRRLDALVDYARTSDPGATMLMTLGEPPRWASDLPDDAGCAYGVGTCGAPADLDVWRAHVRKLARRYQGRIRHWELWNEPDNRVFYSSPRSMADLARVAAEELKAADPANRLFSPGVTSSGGLLWLHNFLEAGGGRYIDGVGFHWYFGAVPEQLAGFMANVRTVMANHGIGDLPVWNTEGAPICRRRAADKACVLGDLDDNAVEAVAPRAILTMWLNGVSAFAYYTAEGAGERTIPLLAGPDWKRSTRAAARLEMLGSWLAGSRPTAVERPADGTYAVTLARPGGGGPAYVVWTDGGTATWRAPSGSRPGRVQALGDDTTAWPGSGVFDIGPIPQLITTGAR